MSLRVTPTMLHSIDTAGRIMEVSELWLERLGYTLDEVIGRPSLEFLSEESARYARDVVLPAFFRSGTCDVEYEMRRKDGTLMPVRLRGVALRNEAGAFVRSIAVIEDLTELRALQHKMFAAQKLESLGLMAGNIAHDFNNLLASIVGNAQLARRHAGPQLAVATALDHIMLASARAADLCRQLLAYSGRGHFEIEVIDLDALVAEMSAMLAVNVGEHARIELALGSEAARVEVDATQIRQVLLNLVINAGEAVAARAAEAPGTIRIETSVTDLDDAALAATARSDARPGRYVRLVVADDGVGMPPEVRTHIFDPFFTTKASGRGLGLAAVHGIVRGHHGTLRVDSAPGAGTRFEVFLPLATLASPRRPPAPLTLDRGTVAVVDDDDLLRATLAGQLAEAGYAVRVAASAEEALAVARGGDVGAFLVDASLRGPGGAELASRLRAAAPGARIVLMSGFAAAEAAPGADTRFLHKPFSEQELLRALEPRSAT